eukprot:m.386520 g.386520  ORF g.386520 m.386520 type:complete len:511 (+) comp21015_c0_seq1:318-1850(+)
MTSPFTSLVGGTQHSSEHRHRRRPLNPADMPKPERVVPVRPRNAAQQLDALVKKTSGADDRIHGAARSPRLQSRGGPSKGAKRTAGTSDLELLSAMTARLSKAESALKIANAEIERQHKVLCDQERQIAELKLQQTDETNDNLKVRYMRLQTKTHQMESFLQDYGMIWVGDDDIDDMDTGSATDNSLHTPADAPPDPHASINFDKVIRNIGELNALAGEGVGKVVQKADGSRQIEMPAPVALRLYQNGVLMFQGPFRDYNEPTTQQLIQDFLDGFFPSELQSRYPDGVPFEVFDLRAHTYTGRGGSVPDKVEQFPGVGHVVGGAICPSTVMPSSAIHQITDAQRGDVPVVSSNMLLNRLPKQVVVGKGKIVDIRGDISNLLMGSSPESQRTVSVLNTPVVASLKEHAQELDAVRDRGEADVPRPSTAGKIATIQVKSEDGKETFVLKLKFSDTVGTMRTYIDRHRGDTAPRAYKLVSTYPRKDLHDDMVLQDNGLTPQATIRMMKAPPMA